MKTSLTNRWPFTANGYTPTPPTEQNNCEERYAGASGIEGIEVTDLEPTLALQIINGTYEA